MLLDGAGRDIWGESWRWRRWVFLFISLLASVYTLRLALALALDGGLVGHIKAPLVEYSRAVMEGAWCGDANDTAGLVCVCKRNMVLGSCLVSCK